MLLAYAAGCGAELNPADAPDSGRSEALTLPWPREVLAAPAAPADNPATEAKRLLGRALFYDPVLSRDRATACVTCHSEIWGLGDQLARSVGVDGVGRIGPGRVGPHVTRRNAQALWNTAYRSELFWDGRTGSLEAQVFFPLEAQDELARDPDQVIAELSAIPAYVALFRAAFPRAEPPVSRDTFAKALATFMRAYVADRTPYDQFLAGDTRALSDQDLRGLFLFADLGCHDCHVPPRFDSEHYAARHVPNPEGIEDLGRYEITGDASERGAFRVPTLRNARETGPYFHNGAVTSFEAAIQHEVDEQRALTGHRALRTDELHDLTQFLRRALSDTSRKQFPPDSVPSGLSVPLDGDRFLRGSSGD
ncbi:MAG TPA: cytochrome c peroxidase [Polyangiales bacterium]